MAVTVEEKDSVSSIVQMAIEHHGTTREAVIPILSEVNEKLGYLPVEALNEVSQRLHVPGSQLWSVASFYRLLSTRPRGRHVVQYCESAPCHVMGGRQVWRTLQETLGLQPGETSTDGCWTLLAVSCPGVCGVGPVMMIDDEIYGNLTPERLSEILARYR